MKNILVSLAAVLFLISCAPAGNGAKNPDPRQDPKVNPQGQVQLVVGEDFLSAPNNEVKFETVGPETATVKEIIYKAPSNGNLSVSTTTNGIGYGCAGSEEDLKFAVTFEYHLKDATTGEYTQQIAARKLGGVIDQLALKAGDEVRIRVGILSRNICNKATVFVSAVFDNY